MNSVSAVNMLSDPDPILIPDINFTQSQLSKALHEAGLFRASLLQSTSATTQAGLRAHEQPDWAVKLLAKHSVPHAVIEKIGSLTFIKRRPNDTQPYLAYVEQRYAETAPLQFRVAFGPLKNINLPICWQRPDLAEYLTLIQLARVMSAMAALYPHGITVQIVPDNMRAQTANHCPVSCVRSYIDGLVALVASLEMQDWITVETDQARLYDRYQVNAFRVQAEADLHDWQQTDATNFAVKWETARFNAQKNIPQTCHDDAEVVDAAAWRYLVAHRAEILSGMWSPHDAFPLIYANHPNAYQLYSLGTKKTKLPWQISLPLSLAPDVDMKFSSYNIV